MRRIEPKHYFYLACGVAAFNVLLGYLDMWFWHPRLDPNDPVIVHWVFERQCLSKAALMGFFGVAAMGKAFEQRKIGIAVLAAASFLMHFAFLVYRPISFSDSPLSSGLRNSLSIYYFEIALVWAGAALTARKNLSIEVAATPTETKP